MKKIKPKVEKEIQIKEEEEMINLIEENKLEWKKIKQNINKSINYESKKETFFFYFFFSLWTASFSSCYKEEKIILNKGEFPQIKINRDKNSSFYDKKY